MKAIQIKQLPFSETSGYEIQATCADLKIVERRNFEFYYETQALALAFKIAKKLDWNVKKFSQGTFEGCEYFCFVK